ncbi:hypothetical protein A2Z33_03850 [Candidatus Gottesmanbacteria bacterium RBG_16_52_11]|uniref:Glycosyltransferase RgtA/B/C/D-like domain-containing protein n=1 Tax=Candidatus Gottesmanbacteria bacterium RBG_16_52_11 TaxID=1798374 RepID=A0A1F5YVV4_9BACT|nr:MAG: hypothetical protein A2Z33_03850 [Candidatus Gottesmanbacteria bacterium RBG_16_52_11]
MKGKIFFILCTAFVVFSMWPTVYEIGRRDDLRPNRYFELVHNFYTDFNFYLSRIRQGLEGNLTVHETYTSEPHQGSFLHVMYLGLGWLGRFVRIPWHRTADIYHVSRIVLAFTLLWMMVEIARRTFTRFRWQLVAFLFAVTASTWPKFVPMDDGSTRIGGYMPWWSVMDSLQRITFIPHLLASQILIAFILYAMSDPATIRRPGNWIFVGFLMFALGIILPPGYLFVVAALGMMVVLEFLLDIRIAAGKRFVPWMLSHSLPRVVPVFMGAPAIIYLALMTSFFPWKQLALADILNPLPFRYPEYLQALGPMLPLGIMGLIWAIVRRERIMVLSAAWIIAWAALLVIFNFIPQQSPLRFSEMIPHIPLSMLGAYFFMRMAGKFTPRSGLVSPEPYRRFQETYTALENQPAKLASGIGKLVNAAAADTRELAGSVSAAIRKQIRKDPPVKVLMHFWSYLLPAALIIFEIAHMHSSWLWQRDFVDHKIRAMYPLVPTGSYVMYPLKDFVSAIRWIQDNTSRDTVILSETTSGNYIPVYSGNRVYVGHDNTVNYQEKELYVKSFFSGRMPADQVRKWLKDDNLNWVFFGPQEKEDGGITELAGVYPFLEEAFRNEFVTVYRVK